VSSSSAPAEPPEERPPAEGARGRSVLATLRSLLVRVRDRSPVADRMVRAVDDYLDAQGSLLAAGMTYYAFLALFPLVAVALGIASLLSLRVPEIEETLREKVTDIVPGADLDALASAGVAVGIIGLAVSLYAGVRWIGALRRSLTVLSGRPPRSVPYLRGLVRDSLTLALLGLAVLASIAFSIVGQLASGVFESWFGSSAGSTTLRALTIVGALLTDLAIGWVLYRGIPGNPLRGRRLFVTAVVAGLGFEVLKQVGGLIVAAASKNVVYGTFAATVGVLIWISYMSKWILFVGAWALVGLHPEPSGTDRPDPRSSEPRAATGGGGEAAGDPAVLPAGAQGDHRDPDRERSGDGRHDPERERQD
jgi:membrane protein